jgi:hypothetical protein
MSNPNPPALVAPLPRWILVLSFLALFGYAFFLGRHTTTVAGGADSSGYLNSARLLAASELHTVLRIPPEFGSPGQVDRLHFFPQGFFPFADDLKLSPTYPTGLPLHLALAGKLFGWHAGPLIVGLAGALAALVLCYAVARELGLAPLLAAAGAVILGACPVFIFTSTQPLSDTLATAWTLAAVYAALRARHQTPWALASGFALAIAVLVRPSNLLLLPALLVFLGVDWRRLALVIVGGLPGAAWFAFSNHTLFGGAFRSGYPDLASAFAAAYGPSTALHFAHWLAVFLPGIVLVLPLAAVFHRNFRSRDLLALGLWFGALTLLYLFYAIAHESWSCLRFLLPALPALIFSALLGLEALLHLTPPAHTPTLRVVAAVLLVAWSVVASHHWTRKLGVLYTQGYEQVYEDANLAARTQLPRDALVVASFLSGALYFYTDFAVLRWDHINATDFSRYAALAEKAGRPVCAVLHESEEPAALRERCHGNWTRLATVKSVGLWLLTPAASAPAAK